MNINKLLIAFSLIFLILIVTILVLFNKSALFAKLFPPESKQTISSDILYLTSPVNSFSGKVEKIEGNIITVSKKVMLNEAVIPPMNPEEGSPMPTPSLKTLTYKITAAENMTINRQQIHTEYLFISPTPPPQKQYTIKDLSVGDYININTDRDLRTLNTYEFQANYIEMPEIVSNISGIIIAVNNNSITIKAQLPPPDGIMPGDYYEETERKEKEYVIAITKDTEISRYKEPAAEPIRLRLTINSLKKGMGVYVYSGVDISKTQSFEALRIEPSQDIMPESQENVIPPIVPATEEVNL